MAVLLSKPAPANFVVHADAFKRISEDYAIPGGTQANTSIDSEVFALGGSYIFKAGYLGLAFYPSIAPISSPASRKRTILSSTKCMNKGEWRLNDMGVETIRFPFGASNHKHDPVDGLAAAAVISSHP